MSTLRSALRVTEPGAVHRSPPSPGRPRGVRVFVSSDILQNLAPLHSVTSGVSTPRDMLTMSLRAAWSPPCPFSTPLCSRDF